MSANNSVPVSRRAIRMRGKLEEAIYDGVVDAWKEQRMISGNPLEWYSENRVYIGYKTFIRRLGNGGWEVDEFVKIYRDLWGVDLEELLVTNAKQESNESKK